VYAFRHKPTGKFLRPHTFNRGQFIADADLGLDITLVPFLLAAQQFVASQRLALEVVEVEMREVRVIPLDVVGKATEAKEDTFVIPPSTV